MRSWVFRNRQRLELLFSRRTPPGCSPAPAPERNALPQPAPVAPAAREPAHRPHGFVLLPAPRVRGETR